MKSYWRQEFRFSFTRTIPVMLGYLFLGIAFGLMLQDAGYGFWWAFFSSLCIYAGSMQFVLVTFLTGGVNLFYAAVMTLFINGRHLFYGLSFIEKFQGMGRYYPYMIFSLTDETYSVLCDIKVPDGLSEKRISFLISLLDHCYWIAGAVMGAVIGQLITLDTTGIDFSMTALFVVIVVNQWMDSKEHRPALLGLLVGIASLLLLGPDKFLLPALSFVSIILLGVRKKWNME